MPASVLSVSRFRRASRGGAFGVPFAAPACQRKPGHCWPGLGVWWTEGGSNSRPPHCERGALPAELSARETRNYSRCLGVWEGGVEQRMTQRAQRDWRECGGAKVRKATLCAPEPEAAPAATWKRVTDAKRLARTWGAYYNANTCFTRSVSSRSMMPKSRSMLGCLPGWARAWSVCSAKSSSPLRAASGVSAP